MSVQAPYTPDFIRVAEVVKIKDRGTLLISDKPLPAGTYEPGDVITTGEKKAHIIGIEHNCLPNPPQQGFLVHLRPDDILVGELWRRARDAS